MKPISWITRHAVATSPRARSRPARPRLRLEPLEDRVQPSGDVRSIDGTGNNLQNPTWGGAGTDLLRLAPADYADGVSTPAGADRPSARAVSDAVAAQGDVDIVN